MPIPIEGPRHASQILTNARGMVRRAREWAGTYDGVVERDLGIAEQNLTNALARLKPFTSQQQATEREQREATRHDNG